MNNNSRQLQLTAVSVAAQRTQLRARERTGAKVGMGPRRYNVEARLNERREG